MLWRYINRSFLFTLFTTALRVCGWYLPELINIMMVLKCWFFNACITSTFTSWHPTRRYSLPFSSIYSFFYINMETWIVILFTLTIAICFNTQIAIFSQQAFTQAYAAVVTFNILWALSYFQMHWDAADSTSMSPDPFQELIISSRNPGNGN